MPATTTRSPALICGALLVSCGAPGRPDGPMSDAAAEIIAENLRADVAALSADEMQGRATGTEGERRAADYMRILFETARRVANADAMPRWEPGNEFEEEWRRLHGMGE